MTYFIHSGIIYSFIDTSLVFDQDEDNFKSIMSKRKDTSQEFCVNMKRIAVLILNAHWEYERSWLLQNLLV